MSKQINAHYKRKTVKEVHTNEFQKGHINVMPCHDMEVYVTIWKSMSRHRPTFPDHPGLCHDMEVYVTIWKSMSRHGSLCHDREVYVTIWKSMSRQRPISSKSDIQKSPITKKCMVVKGLRNPIE